MESRGCCVIDDELSYQGITRVMGTSQHHPPTSPSDSPTAPVVDCCLPARLIVVLAVLGTPNGRYCCCSCEINQTNSKQSSSGNKATSPMAPAQYQNKPRQTKLLSSPVHHVLGLDESRQQILLVFTAFQIQNKLKHLPNFLSIPSQWPL